MNLIYTTHQKVIEIDKTPAHITLHFFGDVHRDSSCDVDRWRSFLNRTKETQDDYTFYIGMGDYHDFASMSEQKKLLSAGLHETTMENIDSTVERMNRAFCLEISHMKGKLLGMIEGNHSWTFVNTGRTSTEDIASRMECDYLGWLTHYTLVFRLPNVSAISFYIVACHGRAGGKTYGVTLNQVSELKNIFPISDLFVMGHDHQRVADPISVLIPVRGKENYRIKQKEQLLCRSGSFKKSYEPGRGGYEMSRLLKPANLGALQVNVDINRIRTNGDDYLQAELSAIV
jgi:hypothetical protein